MTTMLPSSNPLGLGAFVSCLFLAVSCGSTGGHAAGLSETSPQSSISEDRPLERLPISFNAPPAGTSTRIGGDLTATVTGSDGDYRAGPCRVDTPLPVGYPAPTPPGSIDLKTYPSVRLAEVSAAGDPDSGMNKTFWPLFNHIKGHDIAMTSPVEMNYRGMRTSDQPAPESWSMAFLYRQPDLNQTGVEGRVVVRDSEPVTVVAVGMKGNYSMTLVQRGMRQIEDWLAANPQWEPAGDWRALYYNGPTLFWWNKWAEVQLPVRLSQRQETDRGLRGSTWAER
jgi:hypothetical protein